jgi:hypothetical protein
MKAIAILIGVALATSSLQANSKKKDYDFTGTIEIKYFRSDYHYSATTADGHTYSWVCNADSHNVDCVEGTGIFREMHLQNGTRIPMGSPVTYSGDYAKDFFDPLSDLALKNLKKELDPPLKGDGTPRVLATFKYRLASVSVAGVSVPEICVPYILTDKKGKVKDREACYLVP